MYAIVLTTAGGKDEAEKIASAIISARKAACIQCLEINSFYFWDGKVNNDPEILMLIKSRKDHYKDIEEIILSNHSYDLPEIIQVDIDAGLGKYLEWIKDETA